MVDLTSRERLLPFLLDRLTNDKPQARQESVHSRTWTIKQAHQAVVRDLGWLLNSSCRPESDNLQEFPELFKSVLNYGMPDLCGRTASSLSPVELERMLKETILRFEPRIIRNTLRVKVVQGGGDAGRANAVVLEIKGEIWAQPMPDSLYLKTEVDLESGECLLQDKQY